MRALIVVLLMVGVALARGGEQADPYDVLGISRQSTDAEIRKTFKKMARQYHPDAQQSLPTKEADANRKYFMSLSTAYETLTNKEKKLALDEGRHATGVDKNYLRYNLFNDDFPGAQANPREIRVAMERGAAVVFFWSTNFPESIDGGLAYKKAAAKLDLTEITVFSYKCDDDPSVCRDQRLGAVPIMAVYSNGQRSLYSGTWEPHAMTEFCLEKCNLGVAEAFISSDVFSVCPNPAAVISDPLAPYFHTTMKRSTRGTITHDFVIFEYSKSYDGEIELKLARELLGRVDPTIQIKRLDCGSWRYEDYCDELGIRRRDKAWTIARVQQRCWYAMKKPYQFSHEECEPVVYKTFDGKHQAWEFVRFILGKRKSHALKLQSSGLDAVKSRETAYAILLTPPDIDQDVALRWQILARDINVVKPVVGKKGFPLKLATMKCSDAAACNAGQLPAIHLYGYGLKVKKNPPVEYTDLRSLRSVQRRIMNDVEPLHLHILTPSAYNTKVNGALQKGKHWLILYNAGAWCPPCNQIRGQWSSVARAIQESEVAKKLSVGVVECDDHKSLCQKLNLQNFPTMSFLAKGKSKVEFNGDRNGEAIAEWAINLVDNRLLSMSGGELQQRYQSGETFLVCFSAGAWCPPCTALGPKFKKVANKMEDLKVVKVDCDHDQQGCNAFGISGFPTVKLLKNRQALEYEGEKSAKGIHAWAKRMM